MLKSVTAFAMAMLSARTQNQRSAEAERVLNHRRGPGVAMSLITVTGEAEPIPKRFKYGPSGQRVILPEIEVRRGTPAVCLKSSKKRPDTGKRQRDRLARQINNDQIRMLGVERPAAPDWTLDPAFRCGLDWPPILQEIDPKDAPRSQPQDGQPQDGAQMCVDRG